MKDEQQPLHCLSHKFEGYKPLRVIIDNTTNNLIQEKHGRTLEGRKDNFSMLLVDVLPRLTYFLQNKTETSHHAKNNPN